MQCRFCGKPLSLLKELTESEFCSREHRLQFRRLTKLAMDRLLRMTPVHTPAGVPTRSGFEPLRPPRPAPLDTKTTVFLPLQLTPCRWEWQSGPAGMQLVARGHSAAPALGMARGSRGGVSPQSVNLSAQPDLSSVKPLTPRADLALMPAFNVGGALGMLGAADFHAGRPPAPAPIPSEKVIPADSLPFCVPAINRRIARCHLQPLDLPPAEPSPALSGELCLAPVSPLLQARESADTRRSVNTGLAFSWTVAPPLRSTLPPSSLPCASALLPHGPLPLPLREAESADTRRSINMDLAFSWTVAPPLRSTPPPSSLPCASALSPHGPLPLPLREAESADTRRSINTDLAFSWTVAPPVRSIRPPSSLPCASALPPHGPLPLPLRETVSPAGVLSQSQPLAFAAPALRRPKLQAAPNNLTLPAEDIIVEEFYGADIPAVPDRTTVDASSGSTALLPALASLFRYNRPSRAIASTPLMVDGLAPLNRLGVPAAFMEIPIPAPKAVLPKSSHLRIVETFEYLRPMEEPATDLFERLVRFWKFTPVYVRYATVSVCIMLLFFASVPTGAVSSMIESRWSQIQAEVRGRAAVAMSEDFQSGMQQWEGRGDWPRTWRVDKAGYARPGRLALYQPSMHMRDYRIEFLAQIERQAVAWVYRAVDNENYYAAKITVVQPGPLPVMALVRYPVIGGQPGERVEIPIRVLMHNGMPYRVQLTVNGSEFTTSIEGQIVDFWHDEALKAGGFGFFSETGERARIYWMKLSHQDDFIGRVCAYFDPMPVDKKRYLRSN